MKTNKIIASTISSLIVIALSLSVLTPALAVSQADINNLKDKQQQISAAKTELQTQITQLDTQISTLMERKKALDEQNELAQQEIELINEQIDLYNKLIEQKAKELEEAKAAEAEQKEALRVRMRSMEENGSLSYLAVVFEASSFSDLLSRIDFISEIMKYDKQLEDAYIAARQHVEDVKAEYEATKAEHEATKLELEQKKAELEAQIADALEVISSLESDIENYKKQFDANTAQEQSLRSQIDTAIAELERQQQETVNNGGAISSGSGSFMWPTPSTTYVSSPFGTRFHPIFHENRFHSGIDIAAASGATIVAADSGTVVSAIYSSSYGNYVVISHGNGNSTLYAHMSSMAVTSGQAVTKGQTIGYVGSTGWSTGAHLHFEIKIGGQLVDPQSQF